MQWDSAVELYERSLLTTSAQHGHSIRYGVQVLKESFVGNSRTVMIANISPNSSACECVHTVA